MSRAQACVLFQFREFSGTTGKLSFSVDAAYWATSTSVDTARSCFRKVRNLASTAFVLRLSATPIDLEGRPAARNASNWRSSSAVQALFRFNIHQPKAFLQPSKTTRSASSLDFARFLYLGCWQCADHHRDRFIDRFLRVFLADIKNRLYQHDVSHCAGLIIRGLAEKASQVAEYPLRRLRLEWVIRSGGN
jgi:hypothetical protein